jgi:dTDP-4-dehydrorhamnose reductase
VKLLVIGASGELGGELMACARRSGREAIGTWANHPVEGLTRFDLRSDRIVDCLPKGFFGANEPVGAIVCAAVCEIDRCARAPEETRRVNVEKTIELITDLVGLGARVAFSSTSFVFDGAKGEYREDDPVVPICEYGRQKVAVENWMRAKAPQGLVMRLDKLVGCRPHPRNLFTQWVQQAQQHDQVRCIAGQHLSPVALGDAAEAIILACERSLQGVYHLGGPECVRRDELARRFLQQWGREAAVVSLPQEAFRFADPRPLRTCLNSEKLQSALAWSPTPLYRLMERYLINLSPSAETKLL